MNGPQKKEGWIGFSTKFLAVAILLVDGISKFLTHHFLPVMTSEAAGYPYGGIGVFKNFLGIEFSISHTTNTGAAWGIFGDSPVLLLSCRIVLVLAIAIYTFFFNQRLSLTLPFTLIIAGAVGNVLDFFIYGHVVDMFHFVLWGYDYPVFNVADSAIFVGIGWLLLLSWFGKEEAQKVEAPPVIK